MKNILNFILIFVIILSGCNRNQNSASQEVNELLIKENPSSEKKSENKNNNTNEYFIKPLTDSSYTGSVEEKYPNGIVKYKGFYRFGKKHGEWLYFYPNGNMWSEAEFNRDKMHGKSNVYYPNGKPHYSGFYKNNLKDSVWRYYDSSGTELYNELYKNGRLIKRNILQK